MADRRKLQNEVDRTLKKIDEGIAVFEQTLGKYQNTANQSQREKLGEDLKKEIKKLQRHRDHVKQWQSGNEVKDKDKLLNARTKIESQMEIFKNVERENKAKAYSKLGGGTTNYSNLDPEEKERLETRDKIDSFILKLKEKSKITNDEWVDLRSGKPPKSRINKDGSDDDEGSNSGAKPKEPKSRKDRRRNKKEKRSQSAKKTDHSSTNGSSLANGSAADGNFETIPLGDLDQDVQQRLILLEDLKECCSHHIIHLEVLLRMIDNGSVTAEQIFSNDVLDNVEEFIGFFLVMVRFRWFIRCVINPIDPKPLSHSQSRLGRRRQLRHPCQRVPLRRHSRRNSGCRNDRRGYRRHRQNQCLHHYL